MVVFAQLLSPQLFLETKRGYYVWSLVGKEEVFGLFPIVLFFFFFK